MVSFFYEQYKCIFALKKKIRTYSTLLVDACESKLEFADPCVDPRDTISLGGSRYTWFRLLNSVFVPLLDVFSCNDVVSQLLELLPGPPRLSQSYLKKNKFASQLEDWKFHFKLIFLLKRAYDRNFPRDQLFCNIGKLRCNESSFIQAYHCYLFTWMAEKIESNWKPLNTAAFENLSKNSSMSKFYRKQDQIHLLQDREQND